MSTQLLAQVQQVVSGRAGSSVADRSEGYAGPGWRVSTWLNVIHHTLTPHVMWLPQNANMYGRDTCDHVHCLL